jgi:prepilin signal peptidase PulO-like enzyme (type II secretory pathway)
MIKLPAKRVVYMLIIYIKIVASIFAGFFAGMSAVYIFNRMPAKWLCDYGKTPEQELTDPYVQRVKGNPWRWVYAVGFIGLCLRLSLADTDDPGLGGVQLAVAGLFACWSLLIIGLADLKYMIIPDQFVIMLALTAVGFVPLYKGEMLLGPPGVWQPVIGMFIGGGFMLAVAGIGALILKKEVMGFGDVKLSAAMGLVLGIAGTIAVLTAAILVSGAVAAVGLISGKVKPEDSKPLGPFLAGSAIAYIFIAMPFYI